MSGLETVAAIMGIAGAGVSISAALYDYASATSNAKEDMRSIADSIDTYSSVLETLGRQIETSQAVCSPEGLRLAVDLQRQSDVLFKQISENIPAKTETATLGQKLSWHFNKNRVTFLLGQIEQLKATVSLLVQILILAQTTKPVERRTKNVNINVNIVNTEIDSQFRRAENRVLQYHNASSRFAQLQIEDQQPVIRNALPWVENLDDSHTISSQADADEEVAIRVGGLSINQPRMSLDDTNANSAQLVNMLLDHWTTVAPDIDSSVTSSDDFEGRDGEDEDTSDVEPETTAEPTTSAVPTPLRSVESSANPVKNWWQRYRESQKVKEEEQRVQKELQDQEKDIAKREARLLREQTLVDRELKLQEARKKQQADQSRALAEKQLGLTESQKLAEEAAEHARSERELQAQESQRQKDAKKEHDDRRKAMRRQSKIARKYSSRPPRATSSTLSLPSQEPPSRSSTALPSSTNSTIALRTAEAAPPPYSFDEQPTSPPARSEVSLATTTSEVQNTILGKTVNDLHISKSTRRQKLKEIRQARKHKP